MDYSDFQFLQFDRRADGVLLVTLNRPEVMNAANARLHWELTRIWGVINDDPQTRVAVVTGAGDRAFSAGGDLDWIADTAGNAEMVANTLKEAGDIVFNMLACEKPIVSAIASCFTAASRRRVAWPSPRLHRRRSRGRA